MVHVCNGAVDPRKIKLSVIHACTCILVYVIITRVCCILNMRHMMIGKIEC